MTKLFESEDYITEPNDVTVDGLTAEMAGWLVKHPAFLTIRADAMGSHPALYAYLRAVTSVGQNWVSSLRGTPLQNTPEQPRTSKWVTTREAADLLGVQPRAVIQAINRNRLSAEQVEGRWRIQRTDLEHYRATRVA